MFYPPVDRYKGLKNPVDLAYNYKVTYSIIDNYVVLYQATSPVIAGNSAVASEARSTFAT